jgi:hypothetical protein
MAPCLISFNCIAKKGLDWNKQERTGDLSPEERRDYPFSI